MKHKAMYSTMMREKDPNNPRTQIQLRREAAVRALFGRTDGKLSQEIIEDLKKDLGVSRATAYRMIKTFRSCGMVVAPTTRPVGRPKGARVLDPKREFLIHDAYSQLLPTAVAAEIQRIGPGNRAAMPRGTLAAAKLAHDQVPRAGYSGAKRSSLANI